MSVDEIVSTSGAALKAKLSNPAATGAPEDELRSPLEGSIRGLAELSGMPPEAVVPPGESALADLSTRPDHAVTRRGALIGFIEAKASAIRKGGPEAWLYFYENFLGVSDGDLRKKTGSPRDAIERPVALDVGCVIVTGLDRGAVLGASEAVMQAFSEREAAGLPQRAPEEYCIAGTSGRVGNLVLGTARLSNIRNGLRGADAVAGS